MSSYINPSLQDAALSALQSEANEFVLFSGFSTDYVTITQAAVVTDAVASGDFTLANGNTSGRKITYGGASGIPVSGGGAVDTIAFVDSANSKVLAVTQYPSKTLNDGDTVDVAAVDLWEIEDPA